MYRPELLIDLLITIQCLKNELAGPDAEKVEVAQEAYQEFEKVDKHGEQSLPYMNWKLFSQI